MIRSMWLGGHQGCTHRLFVERYVAHELAAGPAESSQAAPSS